MPSSVGPLPLFLLWSPPVLPCQVSLQHLSLKALVAPAFVLSDPAVGNCPLPSAFLPSLPTTHTLTHTHRNTLTGLESARQPLGLCSDYLSSRSSCCRGFPTSHPDPQKNLALARFLPVSLLKEPGRLVSLGTFTLWYIQLHPRKALLQGFHMLIV